LVKFHGFSAGYGAKLLHTQISFGMSAGYEASGSSTSNFIGLQAGYQAKMHLTQISWVCMLGRSNKC
jgi:hypothetical protein